jgi:hypothetical protein
MTETPLPTDAPDHVAQAVRDLLPELRRKARGAVSLIAFAIAVTAVAIYLLLTTGTEGSNRWEFAMYAGFAGLAAIYFTYRTSVSTQQSLVMPVLARSINFTYSQNATSFVQALPKRLLPDRKVRKGEDLVSGALGAHAIQMAEVKVETGSKNSKTLFKGLVAQFPNRTAMPAFFIALEDKTRPGLSFGGDLSTDGLHHLRNVHGNGRSYGIWVSSDAGTEPPTLSAVVNILTRLETLIDPAAQLYAATSNGVEMHVALSHKRNLFQLGGLFPNEPRIFADVQQALHDLTVPLTLAKALIEAEEKAACNS